MGEQYPQGASVGVVRGEVEALRAMTEVHLRATGSRQLPSGEVSPDLDALTNAALASVRSARGTMDNLEHLGPTRFAFPKRVLFRIARLVSHRLVLAGRSLADAVEATAVVQRDQVVQVQRMNDSVRALVVSADLAMAEAIDRVSAVEPGSAQGGAVESELVLLEARVAELERLLSVERSARGTGPQLVGPDGAVAAAHGSAGSEGTDA